jgi:hypothetical protein
VVPNSNLEPGRKEEEKLDEEAGGGRTAPELKFFLAGVGEETTMLHVIGGPRV